VYNAIPRHVSVTSVAVENQNCILSVSVTLVIQHAKHMRPFFVVICDLPDFTIFFHVSRKWHDFPGQSN